MRDRPMNGRVYTVQEYDEQLSALILIDPNNSGACIQLMVEEERHTRESARVIIFPLASLTSSSNACSASRSVVAFSTFRTSTYCALLDTPDDENGTSSAAIIVAFD